MDIETIRAEIRESQARCNHRLIKIVSSQYRYKCIKCQKKLKIASGVMVVDRKPLLKVGGDKMAKVAHTHIDSSGCFLCPLGSACDKPNAGEQFDAMQEALEQIANGIVMNPDSSYSHADTVLAYQKLARIAIAKAKGKAKVKG